MNTQERLSSYWKCLGQSEEKAKMFLEENRKVDRRFASLVNLGDEIMAAFREGFEERVKV